MRDRENWEQFGKSPTEASKGFLEKWKNVLLSGCNIGGAYVGIKMASECLAHGQNEAALLWGAVAGCGVTAAALRGVSMYLNSKK